MEAHLDALLRKRAKQPTPYTQQQQQQRQSSLLGQSSYQAKIQKVQPYLRERPELAKYYFPKLVSIGPIHRLKDDRKINLEQEEEYKQMWASMYLNDKGGKQEASQLLGSIRSKIETLKGLYTVDAIQGFNDDDLAWILFVDGCAVLHFMNEVIKKTKIEALDIVVQHDLLLLENQLPFLVLMMLSNGDNATLRKYIKIFLELHHMFIPYQKRTDDQREPTHLLDLLRTTILAYEQDEDTEQWPNSMRNYFKKYRNARQLITSGIGIKRNVWGKNLTSIDFRRRNLCLSRLTVDDFTAQILFNMIAYERCPDFKSKYEINEYMFFMNSLIDHADDVKVLREAGVVKNLLKSDEEVANIFNTLSSDLLHHTGKYNLVRDRIEEYYGHEWRVWFAEWRHTHFRSPWHFIGVFSTFLGIILTAVQIIQAFHKD